MDDTARAGEGSDVGKVGEGVEGEGAARGEIDHTTVTREDGTEELYAVPERQIREAAPEVPERTEGAGLDDVTGEKLRFKEESPPPYPTPLADEGDSFFDSGIAKGSDSGPPPAVDESPHATLDEVSGKEQIQCRRQQQRIRSMRRRKRRSVASRLGCRRGFELWVNGGCVRGPFDPGRGRSE